MNEEKKLKTIEAQLKEVVKAQRELQDSLNRIDRDLGEDRKDISDLKIQMGTVNDHLDDIRGLFNRQTDRIKDTVKDSVSDVKDKIEEVKEIVTEGGEK